MKVGKFAVAVPIYNSRFNVCKKYTDTVSSFAGTVITINHVTTGLPPLDYFFGKLSGYQTGGRVNKVILGPSTSALNTGAVEILDVVTASGVTVTVRTAPAYIYADGDPITLIGCGMPAGWHGTAPGGSTKVFKPKAITTDSGYSDQFGFNLYQVTTASFNNQASIQLPKMTLNTYYRLTMKYKTTSLVNESGSGIVLSIIDKNGSGVDSIAITANASDWTEATTVFHITTEANPYYLLLYAYSGTVFTEFNIAGISLNHSTHYGYDNQASYIAGTITEIDEYPRVGSVKVQRNVMGGRLAKNIDHRIFRANVLDDMVLPVTRYAISYEIVDASSTTIDMLNRLLSFQSRGYLINHFPEVTGLPYVLTGRISLSNKQYFLTDLDVQRFNLVFEEVF